LVENITKARESNKVDIAEVALNDELVIDTLMETGTGKTFTFLESISGSIEIMGFVSLSF